MSSLLCCLKEGQDFGVHACALLLQDLNAKNSLPVRAFLYSLDKLLARMHRFRVFKAFCVVKSGLWVQRCVLHDLNSRGA
jgi:hypothetical protein